MGGGDGWGGGGEVAELKWRQLYLNNNNFFKRLFLEIIRNLYVYTFIQRIHVFVSLIQLGFFNISSSLGVTWAILLIRNYVI